jgi:hypothetical protein
MTLRRLIAANVLVCIACVAVVGPAIAQPMQNRSTARTDGLWVVASRTEVGATAFNANNITRTANRNVLAFTVTYDRRFNAVYKQLGVFSVGYTEVNCSNYSFRVETVRVLGLDGKLLDEPRNEPGEMQPTLPDTEDFKTASLICRVNNARLDRSSEQAHNSLEGFLVWAVVTKPPASLPSKSKPNPP